MVSTPAPRRAARFKRMAALLLFAAPLLAGCHTKQIVGNEATILGAEHVCSSCHGLGGRNDNPNFPILAGQQREYTENQLKAFRDKTRADPRAHTYMWGMAAKLDDHTIEGLAALFSAQMPPTGRTEDPALVVAGEKIFRNGIETENVPACQACHGENAEGNGAIPRLSGQHRAYLEGQLAAFKSNARANEIMHSNAAGLNPQQISDIAAYLASL